VEQYMLFSLNFDKNETHVSTLKGNSSCKTYDFRIKVRNVQKWSIGCYQQCNYKLDFVILAKSPRYSLK